MAFSTELVLAAQTGPAAQLIEDSVTSGTSTNWSRTITLPEGQWLIVARCRAAIANASGSTYQTISIDGSHAFRWYPGNGSADCANATAMRQVQGGRVVTIAISGNYFVPSRGWDFYAARIG